jgi:DNA-binding LacI/PurR family transcriptional regulator
LSTIRDIAKLAGVSVSTASLAFNGDARVRESTRTRVLEAARSLGYRPHRAARMLSSGRTQTIHLLNPVVDAPLSSGFFMRFSRGVHDVMRETGYSVSLSVLDSEAEAEEVLKRLILERAVDGVILVNPSQRGVLIDVLRQADFPFVLLGQGAHGALPSVDNDNVQVALDATQHLLERGAAPILFLNGAARQTFVHERLTGYKRALEHAREPFKEALVHHPGGSAADARRYVAELLRKGLHFRSVLAVSDPLAIGAMRALRERNLRIPEDVAVVGMNNDELADYVDPPLTSVDLDAYGLGQQTAIQLLQLIADRSAVGRRVMVAHRLVIRGSS